MAANKREKEKISSLEEITGYSFKNWEIALMSLIHSSYVAENKGVYDNERLEFLGDAVLDLVIGEILYKDFPDSTEGDLTRMRAWLVNEEQLSAMASTLGLGDLVLLGRGEESSGGSTKSSILADLFEAVTGAIYLDGGLEAAKVFIIKNFKDVLPLAPEKAFKCDYKSELQEFTQRMFHRTPDYEIEEITGPDHDRTFHFALYVDGKKIATGAGGSKKAAQQNAAAKALKYFREKQ